MTTTTTHHTESFESHEELIVSARGDLTRLRGKYDEVGQGVRRLLEEFEIFLEQTISEHTRVVREKDLFYERIKTKLYKTNSDLENDIGVLRGEVKTYVEKEKKNWNPIWIK